MLRHRNWVMLGSVLLYFAARQFGWNLPSYPSGVWYFNPFAWQLLFGLGAWLALGGPTRCISWFAPGRSSYSGWHICSLRPS
jgi:hypothetical protein